MNLLTRGAILVVLLGGTCLAETLSHSARDLGVVVLEELAVRDGKIIIRVPSNGCTDKAAIRASARKQNGMTERMPHYAVTFERVRADDCKALLADGVVLEYDVAEDLGLPAHATLAVTNWVHVRSEETSEGETALRRGLLAATVRAVESEIRACEGRLKTAQGGVGPAENVERFGKQLEDLRAQLATFREMKPADYPLQAAAEPDAEAALPAVGGGPLAPPRRVVVTVRLEEPCKEGTMLPVDGLTKSGPFYHVSGMSAAARARLQPGKRQELTLYLVYRRAYLAHIPNHYVYVAEVK